MKPIVSICIPNYNMAKYLDKAIESAMDQDFQDYEILIVDDCSTDSSLEVARKYSPGRGFHYRIEKSSRNLGMTENWNYCLDLAQGEYIVLLNADDILEPDFLKVTAGLLEAYPSTGFAGVEAVVINSKGEIVKQHKQFYPGSCLCPQDEEFRILSLGNHYQSSSAVLFRKQGIEKVGTFWAGLIWCSDYHMWWKLCTHYDALYIDKHLLRYREHEDNCTSQVYRLNLAVQDLYRMRRKVFDSLPDSKGYLKKYEPASIRRLAKLCFRYAIRYLEDGLWENARESLFMAQAYDDTARESEIFRQLSECLQGNKEGIAGRWPEIKPRVLAADRIQNEAPYPYPQGYQAIAVD